MVPFRQRVLIGRAVILIASAFVMSTSQSAVAALLGLFKSAVVVKITELPQDDHNWGVHGLDFSPDGDWLAADSEPDKILVWDWRNKQIVKNVAKPRDGNDLNAANPIRFSPDGRFLANCEEFGAGHVAVRVWNTKDWAVAKDFTALSGTPSPGVCTDVAFTPDGRQFIRTADTRRRPSNNLVVYSVDTWEPLWGLSLDGLATWSLSVRPDGKQVAISGQVSVVPAGVTDSIQAIQQMRGESYIYLVDLQQRQIVKRIAATVLGPVAWSPDGARIVMTGAKGVEMFDAQSGEVLAHEALGTATHTNVRLTSDGKHLIESDMNAQGTGLGVNIWDGHRQTLLQHISGNVDSVAVSRDGKYFAIGMADRTTVWQFR
jgi:WD40 repeat protein